MVECSPSSVFAYKFQKLILQVKQQQFILVSEEKSLQNSSVNKCRKK